MSYYVLMLFKIKLIWFRFKILIKYVKMITYITYWIFFSKLRVRMSILSPKYSRSWCRYVRLMTEKKTEFYLIL